MELIKVPLIAGNLTDEEIRNIRVDRKEEVSDIIHLITNASENVLISGDRGQGKTFLTRLFQIDIEENFRDIFTIRLDLTALHFMPDDSFPTRSLPQLILDQLCKEVWVKVLKKDYSDLLRKNDDPESLDFFKGKKEKKVVEIHNILKREEKKIIQEYHSSLKANLGLGAETGSKMNQGWRNRGLQNFEYLELLKEIKSIVLKNYNRIVIICDEANKLTDLEQEQILSNYLDFLGTNSFNFLLVVSNHAGVMRSASSINLFRKLDLGGFVNTKDTEEMLNKSFNIDCEIDNGIFGSIHMASNGNIRISKEIFYRCLSLHLKGDIHQSLPLKLVEHVISDYLYEQEEYRKLKLEQEEVLKTKNTKPNNK